MAITPRTIFTSPATAALTAASLFAITATGMWMFGECASRDAQRSPCQYRVDRAPDVYETPCDSLRATMPGEASQLSELDWFRYANCYADSSDSERVITITSEAINYYPSSEALFNLKGYHQLQLKRHEDAVQTLELGLRRVVVPRSGTMENNLAWAGLWVPRELDLDRARALYRSAMAKDASVCEVIHTGLWVEYAVAQQSQGLERAQALRTFGELRNRYAPCQGRYDDGNPEQLMEVLGAVVAFEDVERELRTNLIGYVPSTTTHALTRDVARELRATHRHAAINDICREAIPLATAHHTCVNILKEAVREQQVRDHIRF